MPKNESAFKREFRDSIEEHFGANVKITLINDMFKSGIPDIISWYGMTSFPIEAKFVKKLPKKETSKILTHPVTPIQMRYLEEVRQTGNYPVILIGFEDTSIAIPLHLYPKNLDGNITLKQIFDLRNQGFEFKKVGKSWDVSSFYSKILGECHERT